MRFFSAFLILAFTHTTLFNTVSWATQVDDVCAKALAPKTLSTDGKNQLTDECTAAKADEGSIQGNAALWKVWAAVAGLCGGMCVAQLAGMGLSVYAEYACDAANAGGAVAEAVVTHDYMSALMNVGQMAMTHFGGGHPKAEEKEVEDPVTKEKKIVKERPKASKMALCMNAAMAAYSCYSDYTAAQQGQDALNQELKAIAQYKDPTYASPSPLGPDTIGPGDGSGGSGGSGDGLGGGIGGGDSGLGGGSNDPFATSGNLGGSGGMDPSKSAGTFGNSNANLTPTAGLNSITGSGQSVCARAYAGGDAQAVIQCAMASGGNYPPQIASPGFSKLFQDQTKIPLDTFLGNAKNPTAAIEAGMSAGLNPPQMAALDQVLNDMANDVGGEAASSDLLGPYPLASSSSDAEGVTLTGASANTRAPASETDRDMMGMFTGMMALFGPKASPDPSGKNTTNNFGVMKVIQAHKQMSFAKVAENRNLSLFDRVTFRYFILMKKNNF